MPINEIVTANKLACQLVNWTAGQTLTALEQAMSRLGSGLFCIKKPVR